MSVLGIKVLNEFNREMCRLSLQFIAEGENKRYYSFDSFSDREKDLKVFGDHAEMSVLGINVCLGFN